MKPAEVVELLRPSRPPAPYGVRRLARVYSIEDLAEVARRRIPRAAMDYLDGGGEDEHTLRHNRSALDAVELVPQVLHDVSHLDTRTRVLGTDLPLPIALAPVGAPRLFHHEGELAVARAVAYRKIPYGVGTLGTVALEDVAASCGGAPLWLQLYAWGDRRVARELIGRARNLGFRSLLLTADVTVRSKRERELRDGLQLPTPTLALRTLLDGARHPVWDWHLLSSPRIDFPNVGGRTDIEGMFDGTLSWHDIDWIRRTWAGPLALKGVLSAADAERAADAGVDAVIVSNHGGRQLDHVPATIEVLPEVVDAVGNRVEVIFDSGVRRGTDIVAALALGARAVLVGRAYLYGLAAAGEPGVRHAIDILDDELRIAMALAGARTVGDLRGRVRERRLEGAH